MSLATWVLLLATAAGAGDRDGPATASLVVPRTDAAAGLSTGPLQAGPGDGDLGVVRRALPRTEAAIAIRPAAIVDTPGFYGMIGAALEVSGSYQLDARREVFASVNALQLRFIQNATLTKTQLALGATSLGYSTSRLVGERAVARFVRLHLPTSTEYPHAPPYGVEGGLSGRGDVTPSLSWHGGLSAAVTFAQSAAAGTHPQALVSLLAGGAWTPRTWLSIVVDLAARLGPLSTLELLAPGLGLRFRAGDLGFELQAVVPVAGSSRLAGLGSLRAAYRF